MMRRAIAFVMATAALTSVARAQDTTRAARPDTARKAPTTGVLEPELIRGILA